LEGERVIDHAPHVDRLAARPRWATMTPTEKAVCALAYLDGKEAPAMALPDCEGPHRRRKALFRVLVWPLFRRDPSCTLWLCWDCFLTAAGETGRLALRP
jgi:hypothetical protein